MVSRLKPRPTKPGSGLGHNVVLSGCARKLHPVGRQMPLLQWKRPLVLLASSVCLTSASSATRSVYGAALRSGSVALKAVFSLNNGVLSKLHLRGAWLDAFDISPDGRIFAAEFEALQEGQTEALWVGEWDIGTGKLIHERSVEGPAVVGRLFGPVPYAQYLFDVQFTPDGQRLVVPVGQTVEVLDAETLEPLYSTSMKEGIAHSEVEVIRQVLISRDNTSLVVLSSTATFPWKWVEGRIFSLESGKNLASWNLPVNDAALFSLSPNGSELLMSRPFLRAQDANMVLLDSHSGKLIRAIHSDFYSTTGPECSAKFLDADRIVAACVHSTGGSQYALRVINVRTDQIEQEVGRSKHDTEAFFSIAANTPRIVALIFSWKWGLVWNMDEPFKKGVNWLAIFEPSDTEPLYVRRNIRFFSGGRGPSVLTLRASIRISSDGSTVAFGEGENIEVYRVESNGGP